MGKEHWENIYATKGMQEVSWFQKVPTTSLELIKKFAKNKQDAIIDIGGGDGFLVDNLIALGYTDITVLDISKNAIDRAKKRLGKLAEKVKWIVADINEFVPNKEYVIWHDRAVFHFLIKQQEKANYRNLVNSAASDYFILATFSSFSGSISFGTISFVSLSGFTGVAFNTLFLRACANSICLSIIF